MQNAAYENEFYFHENEAEMEHIFIRMLLHQELFSHRGKGRLDHRASTANLPTDAVRFYAKAGNTF